MRDVELLAGVFDGTYLLFDRGVPENRGRVI
jgi:hypothetical protein